MGTRSTFSITDVEDFIQGQIVELLPEALASVKKLEDLAHSYNQISKKMETTLNHELSEYGLRVPNIQILSALPSQEVIDALEAKTAIKIIGSQKEYLLYKAATSLGQQNDSNTNDPLQMMMGIMLGKGLIGADYREKESIETKLETKNACQHCSTPLQADARFCQNCGKRV